MELNDFAAHAQHACNTMPEAAGTRVEVSFGRECAPWRLKMELKDFSMRVQHVRYTMPQAAETYVRGSPRLECAPVGGKWK